MPGIVAWRRTVGPDPERTRILPDGCLDLLSDGASLSVAGPDPAARWHHSDAGSSYVALRFSAGIGPALLSVPADAVAARTWKLGALWSSSEAGALTERVAIDPAASL